MFVEQGGQASAIPLFDDTSAAVFGCLCRLTDGNARRALELLVDVYVTVASTPDTAYERTGMVDVARRLYLAADRSPIHVERVVADMHFVDHRPLADIATVVDQHVEEVAVIVGSLPAPAAADLRRSEVWFDDATRAEAERAIADRLPHPEGRSTSVGRSRRRASLVAALAVAVGLGALTVWVRAASDTGKDAGNSAAAPTTTSPTTTSPTTTAPTTTAPATTATTTSATETTIADASARTLPGDAETSSPKGPAAGYILDPVPTGFVGAGAYTQAVSGDPAEPYWTAMWASPDAGPQTGRWLAVEVTDEDPSRGLYRRRDLQQRVEVGGRPALSGTSSDGVQQLNVSVEQGREIEILSFGIDLDTVAALAAGMVIGSDYEPTFDPATTEALDGLDLLASAATSQPGVTMRSFLRFGANAQYLNPSTGAFVAVMAAPQAPNDLRIASLLGSAEASTAISSETISVDGHDVVVVTQAFDDAHAYRLAMWHAGAQMIQVVGELEQDDLILAVRASRRATAGEWQALVDAEPVAPVFEDAPADGPTHSDQIGSATTAASGSWRIWLSDADSGWPAATSSVMLEQRMDPDPGSSFQPSPQNQLPLPIDPNNPLTHFETPQASILVAAFDGPTAATDMRVTLYRRTPVDVPVVPVADTTLSGAAYVFSELVPYTVDLLDANGTVLQTFTTP